MLFDVRRSHTGAYKCKAMNDGLTEYSDTIMINVSCKGSFRVIRIVYYHLKKNLIVD